MPSHRQNEDSLCDFKPECTLFRRVLYNSYTNVQEQYIQPPVFRFRKGGWMLIADMN